MIWSVRFERILAVTAQGVETAVQRDLLNDLGCDEMQGYFFSRPLPLDAFETFVARFANQEKIHGSK